MSKTLWHTIQIQVPKEMVELTKSGKVSVKKTLTKKLNISRSQKTPAIKLIPSDVNKPHIVNDGKEWDVNVLKERMAKARAMRKKNANKNIFEPVVKRMVNLNKFEGNIIKRAKELGAMKKQINNGIELSLNEVNLMLYDIYTRKRHIPFDLIPKLLINGKPWLETPRSGSQSALDIYNDSIRRGDKNADGVFQSYTYDKYKREARQFKDPRYKLEVYNIKPELFPKGKPVQLGGRKHLRIHHL